MPGSQLAPLQQPLHDLPSQMHLPPEQRCPVTQAGPVPHVQPPVVEQPSPVSPQVWHDWPATPQASPVGGSVQTLPVQQPVAHDVGVHTHDPFEHT